MTSRLLVNTPASRCLCYAAVFLTASSYPATATKPVNADKRDFVVHIGVISFKTSVPPICFCILGLSSSGLRFLISHIRTSPGCSRAVELYTADDIGVGGSGQRITSVLSSRPRLTLWGIKPISCLTLPASTLWGPALCTVLGFSHLCLCVFKIKWQNSKVLSCKGGIWVAWCMWATETKPDFKHGGGKSEILLNFFCVFC